MTIKPFLKWAGGKRQLLPELMNRVPVEKLRRGDGTYYEPFIGGGALFFELRPKYAVIADTNWDLVNCYQVIQNDPDFLIEQLKDFAKEHSPEFFYKIRGLDREENYGAENSPNVFRAARMIYLNKTCFNGLFRVNSQGQFNVPIGRYQNPNICDKDNLLMVSEYLNLATILIWHCDFRETLDTVHENDFVYLDSPYDPINDTASFTGYSVGGFTKKDQEDLRDIIDKISDNGCQFLASNSDTPFVRNLYYWYKKQEIFAYRNINSKGNNRSKVVELLISNY